MTERVLTAYGLIAVLIATLVGAFLYLRYQRYGRIVLGRRRRRDRKRP